MEDYTDLLMFEAKIELTLIIIAVILSCLMCVIFWFTLGESKIEKRWRPIACGIVLLIIVAISIHGFKRYKDFKLDIQNQSFISYTGIVEKDADGFCNLNDEKKTQIGTKSSTQIFMGKSYCDLVYSQRTKILLYYKVHYNIP